MRTGKGEIAGDERLFSARDKRGLRPLVPGVFFRGGVTGFLTFLALQEQRNLLY